MFENAVLYGAAFFCAKIFKTLLNLLAVKIDYMNDRLLFVLAFAAFIALQYLVKLLPKQNRFYIRLGLATVFLIFAWLPVLNITLSFRIFVSLFVLSLMFNRYRQDKLVHSKR
jgi:hypothetical protein